MVEINNRSRSKIDTALVKRVAEKVVKHFKREGAELSIAFVGEKVIRQLNHQYRKKDRVTDILSFEGEGMDLGELIICYVQIKRQGPRFGHTARQELIFILVHGILHLFGETDETEAKRLKMMKHGADLIKKLNLR